MSLVAAPPAAPRVRAPRRHRAAVDTRSTVPLHELPPHADKALCVAWDGAEHAQRWRRRRAAHAAAAAARPMRRRTSPSTPVHTVHRVRQWPPLSAVRLPPGGGAGISAWLRRGGAGRGCGGTRVVVVAIYAPCALSRTRQDAIETKGWKNITTDMPRPEVHCAEHSTVTSAVRRQRASTRLPRPCPLSGADEPGAATTESGRRLGWLGRAQKTPRAVVMANTMKRTPPTIRMPRSERN